MAQLQGDARLLRARGDFLRIALNQNQITNGARPYPRLSASSPILPDSVLGNVTNIASLGYSRYTGVWVTLSQRFAHGVQFNGSYTWSKSRDTNSLQLDQRAAPGQHEHRR